MINDRYTKEIVSWYNTKLRPENGCIHDLFRLYVHELSDVNAVCAWDMRLTYRQLEQISSQL